MAMFLAEISVLLALGLFAAGLVVWHRGREASAGLLRAAGATLVVGSVLTALCTGYFSVRYYVQGQFDQAYAHPHAAWRGMGPAGPSGMCPGMMGPGMMQQGAQDAPMRPGGPAGTEVPPEHEEHHPEPDA